MLVTSKDLFWIVLSFVILWIGVFAGWGLFYMAMMLRDVRQVTLSFRKKLDLVDSILETIKKKMEGTANYLPPLIEGASKLVEHFREKKTAKKNKK